MQTLFEVRFRGEAEVLPRAGGIQLAARLAVGLAGIPADGSLEAGQARDKFRQVFDADFEAGANIDGFRAVIPLGCQGDSFRASST